MLVGVLSPSGLVDGLAALADRDAFRQGVALENKTARAGITRTKGFASAPLQAEA